MSTKRVGAGELPSAALPLKVRRIEPEKVEHVASQSLEGSAPDVRKASPLKGRQVTFDTSVKPIPREEVFQFHANIREAIDHGMPKLIEVIDQIPSNCTPELLNRDSHKPGFPIPYAIEKLKNQPIPIGIFAALFEAGYRPTNLHLFALWDTLDAKQQAPINARDLSSEKQALTGLFLTKMQKDEVGKIVQIFWKAILEIQKRQLPEHHRGNQNTLSSFEFLIGSIAKRGCEKFGEYLVLGFKEIAPSDLEAISKIHGFDIKLLDVLFRKLTLALESGAPLFSIRTLVDIICVVNMANSVHASKLGQSLLLKYLKTSVNLELLTVLLRLPMQIDPQFLGETMQGCTPEVQALLKEKLIITG